MIIFDTYRPIPVPLLSWQSIFFALLILDKFGIACHMKLFKDSLTVGADGFLI